MGFSMRKLSSPKIVRRVFVFTVVATMGMVATSSSWGARGILAVTPSGPTLTTVSSATLAAEGVSLSAPSTQTPAISAAQADSVAENSVVPNATVREHILADLTDSTKPDIADRLVWVVSVMPPGGVWSVGGPGSGAPSRQPGTYMLVFVDAQTGEFLYGVSGGEIRSATQSRQRSGPAR